MKSRRPTTMIAPPNTRRRMTRGVRVGSSGIHGCPTPQEGHTAASGATGIAQSRQETTRDNDSVIGATPMTESLSRVVSCRLDRKSTRLNSSHQIISYAVFCLKKKKIYHGAL